MSLSGTDPSGSSRKWPKVTMIESTIVQNGALYLVQHKAPTLRRALFRRLRRALPNQGPGFRFAITFAQLFRREPPARWWPLERLIHLSVS
jgi:hypothetical protein